MDAGSILERISNGENSYIKFKEENDIFPVEGITIKDLKLGIIRDYFMKYNAFDLFEESEETV